MELVLVGQGETVLIQGWLRVVRVIDCGERRTLRAECPVVQH